MKRFLLFFPAILLVFYPLQPAQKRHTLLHMLGNQACPYKDGFLFQEWLPGSQKDAPFPVTHRGGYIYYLRFQNHHSSVFIRREKRRKRWFNVICERVSFITYSIHKNFIQKYILGFPHLTLKYNLEGYERREYNFRIDPKKNL